MKKKTKKILIRDENGDVVGHQIQHADGRVDAQANTKTARSGIRMQSGSAPEEGE